METYSHEESDVSNNGFQISPLRLHLKKTQSLVDLVNMEISLYNDSLVAAGPSQIPSSGGEDDTEITNNVVGAIGKPKAINFSASLLRIGNWEYSATYEGDLLVRCYFAKRKFIWEILQNGLKRKIEIQWSDIMAIRANCPNDGPGTLTIVLFRQPLFSREVYLEAGKHKQTSWQTCGDFTDGHASGYRVHFLQFPSGSVLNKHYEKMIQSDRQLNLLSRQPEIVLDSPYFETQTYAFENANEAQIHGLGEYSTTSGSTTSLSKRLRLSRAENCVPRGAPSPGSVLDSCALGSQNTLEKISHYLLSDTPDMANSDEKSVMKKVDSLLHCLLQDPPTASDLQTQVDEFHVGVSNTTQGGTNNQFIDLGNNTSHAMSRIDSFEELLLRLPSVATLPRIQFDLD